MINNKKILGNNIKLLRESLNLTQEEFSEKIDISSQTVSLIEAGKAFTTAETLDNICKSFSIPPSKLFEIDSNYINSLYTSRKETVTDINILLNNLDDSKLRHTTEYIQLLNKKGLQINYTEA